MSAQHSKYAILPLSALALAASFAASPAHAAGTLAGWASLPAHTVAEGPTTGQFGGTGFGANSNFLPITYGQAVQGFSAVLHGPTASSFYVMPDNGFGSQGNSADALLRVYAMQPDFKVWNGQAVVGSGTVLPVSFKQGKRLTSFTSDSFISLRDPEHKLGFAIQADHANYYNKATNPVVDPSIIEGRLLTSGSVKSSAPSWSRPTATARSCALKSARPTRCLQARPAQASGSSRRKTPIWAATWPTWADPVVLKAWPSTLGVTSSTPCSKAV